MWFREWSYDVLVAFVVGYDFGAGRILGTPPAGFHGWIGNKLAGHRSPLGWDLQIAQSVLPSYDPGVDLQPGENELLCRALISHLLEYLRTDASAPKEQE